MNPTPNPSSMRLHGLDSLRALAFLIVMLYHLNIQGLLPASFGSIARIGWIGVDLFFVLSGFLIGSQLLKPYLIGVRPSLWEFYRRRAFRILPAFLAVLLLYLFVPLWREAPGPYASWQYATFTWNLLLLGYPEHRAFSHVWSLCVEEHFYLVFPLLLLLLMRKPAVWKTASVLLFIVVGGIALRGWLFHSFVEQADDERGPMLMKFIYYPTYSRLDGLLVGVSAAVVRTFKTQWWIRWSRHSGLLAFIGVICVLGALRFCNFNYPNPDLPMSILFSFPVLACGFGLLVASAVCEKGLMRTKIPGASALASLAFSLYLTHKAVAHATHLLLPGLTAEAGWQSSAIYALTCLGVASLLYWFIERPFITLRARLDRRISKKEIEDEIHLDPAI